MMDQMKWSCNLTSVVTRPKSGLLFILIDKSHKLITADANNFCQYSSAIVLDKL